MNAPDISPSAHPNAYAAFSSGSLALFLVHEAKTRLGFDLTLEEAGWLVFGTPATVLFLAKRFGGGK